MGKLEIGISTSCYYPELTEFAVRSLVEAEVDCMELFFNADSELSGPRFDEILRILEMCIRDSRMAERLYLASSRAISVMSRKLPLSPVTRGISPFHLSIQAIFSVFSVIS